MKRFFSTIHLCLGLSSGLLIMISCFTGAALVFEKELQHSIYPERYQVEPGEKRVPVSQLVEEVRREIPGARISGVKVYRDAERSVEITYSVPLSTENENPAGKRSEKPAPSTIAFMNPYTGDLISLYTHQNSFFYTMFALHRWLLAGDTGKLIMGISTSVFLFILITGIILWWPKTINLRQRLSVKWSAGWKKINHDWHIAMGFYSAIFLFIMAFTGLAWSFTWFNDGIYTLTGTESKRPEPPQSEYKDSTPIDLDDALASITSHASDVQYYSITLPRDSAAAISISTLSSDPAHEKASDTWFLDQYSGQLIGTALYKDRNLGQRVRSLFYPFHVGSIAGIPGRIIALLACVAGFTFPVTGVIMWINRIRKKEKRSGNENYERVLNASTTTTTSASERVSK